MTLKAAEFDRICTKLRLETHNSGDLHALFVYNGKTILRTKRSNKKGDLPFGDKIRQQLKLNEDQLRNLLKCTFGYDDYVGLLRSKNLLPMKCEMPAPQE